MKGHEGIAHVAEERPHSVTVAVAAMSVALALGASIVAFGWREPWVALVSIVIIGSLIFGAARRRNWARWTMATLTIVSTVLTRSLVLFQLTYHVLVPIATVSQLTLEAVGLYLLFRPAAGRWYRT